MGIGGTPKKYGTKEIFPVIIPLLFSSGISPAWCGYLSLPWHEAYLKQLTELLGIQGRLEHLPHELSGGQQQRVAIARALIAKPDVIFADEPTGNLDSKSGGEVMELLQNVWKKMGKALVVITHDSRIARMADRQFQIVDGVLAEVTAK